MTLVCFATAAGCGDDSTTTPPAGTSSTTDPSTTTLSGTTGQPTGTTVVDTTGEPPDDTTTANDTTGSNATDATTGEPTSGTSSGGTTMQLDGTGTTTGGEVCETVLCGAAAVCCEGTDECVLDQCLPACATGIRCGALQDVCCSAGQVCLEDSCEDPLGPCQDSFDCGAGAFCEPTLDQCLPQFDPLGCEFVPEFDDLTVVEEWSYTDEEVISIPAVADVDGDGVQEVIVNAAALDTPGNWGIGGIVVLDGLTGAVEYTVPHNPMGGEYGSHGRATVGVADVSGDGNPDIIYPIRAQSGLSRIAAVDGPTGNLLWRTNYVGGGVARLDVDNGAPSFANFDSDDEAEIVYGATLIDDDGTVVWDQDGGGAGAAYGSPSDYVGGISAIADIAGDSTPEIISGRHAWSVDWDDSVAPPVVTVSLLWDAGAPDGYPAVADLDADGDAEVLIVGEGTIRVVEGDSGLLWCGIDPDQSSCAIPANRTEPYDIPGGGRGGPPTVADFDGDGRPEVAAAGSDRYVVYDFNRAGETVVVAGGFPNPGPGDIYPRWTSVTQDESSHATGSSVFDFQGDGAAEVIYADECYLRVYDGSDGTVILEIESSSATIHEYPLVVDVDDDGNSEIIAVNNFADANCDPIFGYIYRQGVYVYGDANDQWVPTRGVWTSHAYHVTNADSAGNPPSAELDNWTEPGLNNYRQNVQGEGVFNAPDVTIDLNAELGSCDMNLLDVVATVRNQGALGVPAGIEVRLYAGTDASGLFVGTQDTSESLLPGATTQVTWQIPFNQGDPALDFYATVDGDMAADGVVTECAENNNENILLNAECIFPG